MTASMINGRSEKQEKPSLSKIPGSRKLKLIERAYKSCHKVSNQAILRALCTTPLATAMTRQNLRTEKVVSKSATILLLLLSAALILNSEALSAEPSLQQGTVEYANKNYSKALEIFKESVARNPSNAVAHYYLGLCHIQLHNRPAARSEFREAIKYGDYKVTPLAVKALEKMGETVSLPRVPLKVKKILEFYADWCGPCKVFGPVFEASKAKFPEISFERFNVDDAKNSALTGQYRISRIPCVVFLDAAGKTLYNGLPKGVASEWEESIRQFH